MEKREFSCEQTQNMLSFNDQKTTEIQKRHIFDIENLTTSTDVSTFRYSMWIYVRYFPFKTHLTVLWNNTRPHGFVSYSVSRTWQLPVSCDWLGILFTGRWANKSASAPLLYGDGVALVRVCGPSFIFYTGLFVKDYALSLLPSLWMSYRTRGRFSIRHSMNYETQAVRRW